MGAAGMARRRPKPHRLLELAGFLPLGTTCGVFNPHRLLELARFLPLGTTCGVLGWIGNAEKREEEVRGPRRLTQKDWPTCEKNFSLTSL